MSALADAQTVLWNKWAAFDNAWDEFAVIRETWGSDRAEQEAEQRTALDALAASLTKESEALVERRAELWARIEDKLSDAA